MGEERCTCGVLLYEHQDFPECAGDPRWPELTADEIERRLVADGAVVTEAADELARLRAEVAQLREERDRHADFLIREGYQRCDSACNCGEWHGSKWQRRFDECREERDRLRQGIQDAIRYQLTIGGGAAMLSTTSRILTGALTPTGGDRA